VIVIRAVSIDAAGRLIDQQDETSSRAEAIRRLVEIDLHAEQQRWKGQK
jgi:hypothetical protein